MTGRRWGGAEFPFVRHVRLGQPLHQLRSLIGHRLLQLPDSAVGRQRAVAPQRPGGMQVENGQARVMAFGLARHEETATAGKGQQVADLCLVPGAGGHAPGQYLVEQVTARRREQARAQVALHRKFLARGKVTGLHDVAAIETEALQAEVVGHALLGDALQTRLQRFTIRFEGRQAQGETVGGMGAALQLAVVPLAAQDGQVVALCGGKIGIGLARQVQAEPLAGQRLTILEPGVADRLERQAGSTGDAPRRFLGIQTAFFHPQPQVLALPRERDVQHLVDLKVLVRGLEHGAPAGLAMGARPQQLQLVHALTSKATACTAIPSSRPVKPSFSVVVALTLT